MKEIERLLRQELYRRSFYDFVKYFWSTFDPSTFVDGVLIQFYCEVFQYFCRNWIGYKEIKIDLPQVSDDVDIIDVRENKNFINIEVPPRHTKSNIFNVAGPTWLFTYFPIKATSISHTAKLATEMNSKRYALVNSLKYKEIYNKINIVVNTSSFLKDERSGELRSLNRNAFTGYGSDLIINDDLTNAETARKDKTEMGNAWSYYQNTMPSRINDITKCIIMNIQQRLAPNDISGHIRNDINLRKLYTFITLPAIFKKTTYLVFPITGKIVKFEKGDPLWPERFGNYDTLRAQVGQSIFETQYLQNPIATDKTVIKENMIFSKSINDAPKMEDPSSIIYASHDFPVKDKDTSDFLGSIIGYKVGANLYIKDCLEKRMAFVKSVKYVENLDYHYPGIIQVIEDKANGSPILQQLQDIVPGMQAFQPGTDSKTQRLESASLYMESGNVIFLKTKWDPITKQYVYSENMQKLINRLLNYPFVEHDDITDAFAQLVLFVFMDRRYMVYGRAFDNKNIIEMPPIKEIKDISYSTVFFNKEGDYWKVVEIGVQYSMETRLFVMRETHFKASIEEGIKKLKIFAPNKTVFIDCSATEALYGINSKEINIEKYTVDDFDQSVAQLNLAFSKKKVMLSSNCILTKGDIENFKFTKSKDETMKYRTNKDGYVACLRIALRYYGGII